MGAKRPRRGTRFFEVTSDVLCWIGLNQGKYDSYIRVNPFVGVHVVPLMKLECEFEGDKYKKGDYATLSTHLGDLCPEVSEFIFREGEAIEDEAKRLAETIFKYGIPYAKEYSSYDRILPELKLKVPSLGGFPERFAIGLLLSGRAEEAKAFITETNANYQKEESESVQASFKEFSTLFLEKIK